MEKEYSGQHAEYITERYHRISHAEWKILDYIQPKQCRCGITESAPQPPPVSELAGKKSNIHAECTHLDEG